MTHICVDKLTIIGSDNGLSPGRRQAIIWTNAGILLIGPLGTNFSEILIEIHKFLFKEMHLKLSSGKWRPFCLGLIVLTFVSKMGPRNTGVQPGYGFACTVSGSLNISWPQLTRDHVVWVVLWVGGWMGWGVLIPDSCIIWLKGDWESPMAIEISYQTYRWLSARLQ